MKLNVFVEKNDLLQSAFFRNGGSNINLTLYLNGCFGKVT